MLKLKLLTTMQHSSLPLFPSLSPVSACLSPHSTPLPSVTPPGPPRSILHPDNQRALALQGYYGRRLPEGVDPAELVSEMEDEEREDGEDKNETEREKDSEGQHKAEARRRLFQKTRSKAQYSQQKVDQEGQADSPQPAHHDSSMKSLTFSTTTESTDSADLSGSLARSPDSDLVDRIVLSPRPVTGWSPFPVDCVAKIEDLYLPHSEPISSNLRQVRRQMTEKLMSDLDNDDNYDVSPVSSRQPTVDRPASLISPLSCSDLSRSDDASMDRMGGHNGDSCSQTVLDVSPEDNDKRNDLLAGMSQAGLGSADKDQGVGEGLGMSFLSIVKTAVDRQSDSGSDYTLRDQQDHQSCSSDSPRSVVMVESTDVFTCVQTPGSLTAPYSSVSINGSEDQTQNRMSEMATGHPCSISLVTAPETSTLHVVLDNTKPYVTSESRHMNGSSGNTSAFTVFKRPSSHAALGTPHVYTAIETASPHDAPGKAGIHVHPETASPHTGSKSVNPKVTAEHVSPNSVSGSAKPACGGWTSSALGRRGQVKECEGEQPGSRLTEGRKEGGAAEKNTVLYVYHHTKRLPAHTTTCRSDNSSTSPSTATQGRKPNIPEGINRNLNEELPRLSSMQSDSSGFGDVELSADNVIQDMASPEISRLGGSCESSTTLTSTSTVRLISDDHHPVHNSSNNLTATITTDLHTTSSHLRPESGNTFTKLSQSTNDLRSDLLTRPPLSNERFVSMCYIPSLKTKRAAGPPIHRNTITSIVSSPTLNRNTHSSEMSRTQISVMLDEKGELGGVFTKSENKQGTPGRAFESSDETVKCGRVFPNVSRNKINETLLSDENSTPRRIFTNVSSKRRNETPLSEELAQALSQGTLVSSTPRVSGNTASSVPTLTLQTPTLDSASVGSCRETEDDTEREDRRMTYSVWSRELPSSLSAGGLREIEEKGAGDSAEGSSVYSGASTSDSIASGTQTELLDCHKLIKLINQPTMVKGRKTQLLHYKPKRHLRDWPGLSKKKRLQEETCLAQHAIQKYKAELGMLDTSGMLRYHSAFYDMTPEEREDVEELQHLLSEVRRKVMETEQLLTSRMKAMSAGNDCFNSLASITVLHKIIDLLKEQDFQKQLVTTDEEEEEEDYEEEEEEEWRRGRQPQYRRFSHRFPTGSWDQFPSPVPQRLRGRYSSSTSHLAWRSPPSRSDLSLKQLQSSLLSEVRQELRSSMQTLHNDLRERDSEIHRLQLQLMLQQQQRSKKPPRSPCIQSRSLPGSVRRGKSNGNSRETEI